MANKTIAQLLNTPLSKIFGNFVDTPVNTFTNTPHSKTGLESILSRLTPAGRAAAVYSLRNQPLPQAVIDEAVSFLLSDGQPYTAAEIVKRASDVDFDRELDVYSRMVKRASDVDRVLDIYSNAGMFGYAAKFAKENGRIEVSRKFAGLFIDKLIEEKDLDRLFDNALDYVGIDKAMELFL